MSSINFYIRSSKKGNSTIYVRYRNGRSIDFKSSTLLSVCPDDWDKTKGMVISTAHNAKSLNANLQAIYEHLQDFTENKDLTQDEFVEQVNIICETFRKEASTIPHGINEFCEYYIAGMKDKTILNNGNAYDTNTIKAWTSFQQILFGFTNEWKKQNKTALRWDNITLKDKTIERFITYLEGNGYLASSINKYIATFRALVSYAYVRDVHDNRKALDLFHRKRREDGDATTKIYLTPNELQSLYEMELKGEEEKVRDVFLVGCYTGQRVSDYSKLTSKNFGYTPNGTYAAWVKQEKTHKTVVVPVLNENLKKIIDKYNGNLPPMCDVIINRYIKQICKRLSVSVPPLADKYSTKLTMAERRMEKEGRITYEHPKNESDVAIKAKWELVQTHTARRSCVTNLFNYGIFSIQQLMSISGHKTEKDFYRYIRLSGEEIADEIAKVLEKAKIAQKSSTNEYLF